MGVPPRERLRGRQGTRAARRGQERHRAIKERKRTAGEHHTRIDKYSPPPDDDGAEPTAAAAADPTWPPTWLLLDDVSDCELGGCCEDGLAALLSYSSGGLPSGCGDDLSGKRLCGVGVAVSRSRATSGGESDARFWKLARMSSMCAKAGRGEGDRLREEAVVLGVEGALDVEPREALWSIMKRALPVLWVR